MVTRKRAEPEYYLRWTLEDWSTTCDAFSAEAMTEYARCFDVATIHASCEKLPGRRQLGSCA